MGKLIEYKNDGIGAMIADVDTKQGIVTGYFSRFNNVDSDGDIMKPGAFKKTIREQGPNSAQPRIKHLMNHDPAQPLGKLLMLDEDQTGLKYESQIGTHTLGRDFLKMVDSGLITEHSIGFRIIKRNQVQPYENYIKNPAMGHYEISEVKLFEGSSLTAWGANPLTPITSLKSADNVDMIAARQKAIEKFCRNSDASDETLEMLLLHSKQLAQFICDLQQDPIVPEVKATQPGVEIANVIRDFTNKLKK